MAAGQVTFKRVQCGGEGFLGCKAQTKSFLSWKYGQLRTCPTERRGWLAALLRQSEHGLERNFQTQHSRRQWFITKIMWPQPAQWADPLTDQGELTVSVGLINFYSLEAKKIPAEGLASGD